MTTTTTRRTEPTPDDPPELPSATATATATATGSEPGHHRETTTRTTSEGASRRAGATAGRRPTARWHLGRRAHRVALIAHVLASVGWFGIAVAVSFLAIATTATGIVAAPVLRLTLFLSVPVGIAAAATGVVLSVTTRYGLVRYRWVVLKELITVAVVVTDLTVVRAGIVRALDGGGSVDIIPPSTAHVVVLTLATVVSMVKPFGRTRYGRRRLGT